MGRKWVAFVTGLILLSAGVMAAIFAPYTRQNPIQTVLIVGAALLFLLAGFEFLHVVLPAMTRGAYKFGSRGLRGLFADLGWIVLTFAMLLASFSYQRAADPNCGGTPSAGFPLAFLCDDSGGSPINDWGRMSWNDTPLLLGAITDFLFYAALIWLFVYAAIRLLRPPRKQAPA